MKHINDRYPNFYSKDGKRFFLVRCFAASHPSYGVENWTPAVAKGECAFCGWTPPKEPDKQ